MQRMVKIFIVTTLTLISSYVFATPDESQWRSVSVLGANDTHYFVLVAERTHPGSYYSYRERMFIERNIIKLNRKTFSAGISDVQYTLTDPEKGEWQSKAAPSPVFDLAGYIAKEKIVPLYSRALDLGFSIIYKKDGLHLKRKNKSILLRPLGKSRLVVGERISVPGIYYKSGYILLKIAQGQQTIDQDYLEMVLPISRDIYNRVRKQLSDKKK